MRSLLLLLMLMSLPAAAEVYRWVDTQGHVHYGDRSPQRRDAPVKLPPLQIIPGQTPRSGAQRSTSLVREPSASSITATTAGLVRIVSPVGDEISSRTDRSLPISVALQQPLPLGGGLIYRVDGNPVHRKPIQMAAFTATEVERGAHLVDVSVVDASGREVARSSPVLVHIKPPSAH